MANVTGLAAARHALLARAGWDVEERGLQGAPPLKVFAGAEAHVTLWRALRLLGIGRAQVEVVPADDQGAMRADALHLDGPAIVCAQAGNVNSGAIDPLGEIAASAREHGAWVHVDGAFGLWAAASPALAGLIDGHADCDSWATDGHKWLNVPYDCGVVAIRDAAAHAAAMGMSAAYLVREADARSNSDWAPGGLAPRPRVRGLRRAAVSGAARASRRWSSATARSRAGSPSASAARSRSSTTSRSTRSCSRSTTPSSARSSRRARSGPAAPSGTAGRRCASRLELVDHGGRHRHAALTRSSAL
jgi:hypothetical protein